jgi:hypothetical protein
MFAINKAAGKRVFLSRTGALVLVFFLLFSLVTIAYAHQNVTVGDYVVEYGWVSEPAVAGQPNAVVINLSPANPAPTPATGAQPADANIDISGLKIEAMYGGQTKVLLLQPLGENTPGQFVAPMTPMRPGKYTFHLSGTVGSTTFNNDVTPEEVQTTDVVQFPVLDSQSGASANTASQGQASWLGIVGVVLGAIGTLLGVIALVRKPAKG